MIFAVFISLLVLFGLSVFQLLLIGGKPYGEFAWGGQHPILPQRFRIASISAIVLYVVFGIFLVSKAGLVHIIPEGSFLTIAMWVFTSYLTLGIFVNAISRSKKERIVMTPVALLLAIVFLLVTVHQ